MRSFKTLVVVAILAVFTLPSVSAQVSDMTPPVGILNFASDSHIWYGFIPGEIYLVKAEWPNREKSKWYILAFKITNIKVSEGADGKSVQFQVVEEPYIGSSLTRLPAPNAVFDGTITTNAGGKIFLYNMSTGIKTPLIQLK